MDITAKNRKHQIWVDIVKGFAILAVVIWHTSYQLPDGFSGMIRPLLGTLWHVPVFLMIGGFFLKDEELVKPKSFIKKKFKTLYVKLLVYYAVFILLHNLFFKIGFFSTDALYTGKHIYPLSSLSDVLKQVGWAFLAAREPFLGAMWFVNLLFLGLCILSILSWGINRFSKGEHYESKRALAVFFVGFISFVLSHQFGISITRVTPSLCATLLIYVGFVVNKKVKLKFDNKYLFILTFGVLMDIILTWKKDVSLANDIYLDLIYIVGGTFCSLYVLCYIAKKIEPMRIGKIVALLGQESYNIMALHLLGFKIVTCLLLLLGIYKPLEELYSPATNIVELSLYVIGAVVFSLFVALIIKQTKSYVR